MKRVRYTAEFKAEEVRQVTERGHGVVETAKRLGISDKSLYVWIKQANQQGQSVASGDVAALCGEVAQLKRELKRAEEERDILKKAAVCSRFSAAVSMPGRRIPNLRGR